MPDSNVEKTIGGLHSHLLSLLPEYLPFSSSASLLDIGCGTGIFLRRISQYTSWQLSGVDLNPLETDAFTFSRLNIGRDPFPPSFRNAFDAITCIEVIEHLTNIEYLLEFMAYSLKPHGIVILTTPNVEALRSRIRFLLKGQLPNFDDKGDPTHLVPILSECFRRMLVGHDLTVRSCHQYPPEIKKTLMYRPVVNLCSQILGMILPNAMYGDITIYIVQKV